jgi:hypothetical protein
MNGILFLVVLLFPTIAKSISMSTPPSSSPRVAIIGGGAAGLAAARAVSRNGGAIPKVFEKDLQTGGVWRYSKNSKTRPMYRGLRTNLPKEIMAYREKPWTNVKESYITHFDVANYLEEYRQDFDLKRFISFGSQVRQLTVLSPEENAPLEAWPQIRLEWDEHTTAEEGGDSSSTITKSEIFDGVFVCNGHYDKPAFPDLPGLQEYFSGRTMHSVEYDDPNDFRGETVLCIGGRASGADLAKEISHVADHVYVSDSACPPLHNGQPRTLENVTWVPRTLEIYKDQSIRFDDGCTTMPMVDTIIFCSGYDYEFPFINDQSNLDLQAVPGERRVMPLYKQLWHARYPNLAFVGLAHSVIPFPFFELQAEATWAQWNKTTCVLPTLDERIEAAAADAVGGGAKVNGKIQDTHYLGDAQWDYCRDMAKMAGIYDDKMEDYIATNKVGTCCFRGMTESMLFVVWWMMFVGMIAGSNAIVAYGCFYICACL